MSPDVIVNILPAPLLHSLYPEQDTRLAVVTSSLQPYLTIHILPIIHSYMWKPEIDLKDTPELIGATGLEFSDSLIKTAEAHFVAIPKRYHYLIVLENPNSLIHRAASYVFGWKEKKQCVLYDAHASIQDKHEDWPAYYFVSRNGSPYSYVAKNSYGAEIMKLQNFRLQEMIAINDPAATAETIRSAGITIELSPFDFVLWAPDPVKEDPDFSHLMQKHADLLHHLQTLLSFSEYDECAHLLRQYVSAAYNKEEAARIIHQGTHKEAAMRRENQVLQFFSEYPTVRLQLGRLHNDNRYHKEFYDPALAERHFRKALSLNQDLSEAKLYLGMILHEGSPKEVEESIKLLEQVHSSLKKENKPKKHSHWFYPLERMFLSSLSLATIYNNTRNDAATAKKYIMDASAALVSINTKLHRLNLPEFFPSFISAQLYYRFSVQYGSISLACNELQEARQKLQEALDLNKNETLSDQNFKLYAHLGEISYRENDFERAYQYIEQSCKLQPAYQNSRITFVKLLFAENKWSELASHLETALPLIQDQSFLHDIGKKLLNLNQPESARRCFQRVLELNPLHIQAACSLRKTEGNRKKYQQAYEAARAAGNWEECRTIGDAARIEDERDLAHSCFKISRLDDTSPSQVHSIFSLGKLYHRDGNFLRAKEAFLEVRRLLGLPSIDSELSYESSDTIKKLELQLLYTLLAMNVYPAGNFFLKSSLCKQEDAASIACHGEILLRKGFLHYLCNSWGEAGNYIKDAKTYLELAQAQDFYNIRARAGLGIIAHFLGEYEDAEGHFYSSLLKPVKRHPSNEQEYQEKVDQIDMRRLVGSYLKTSLNKTPSDTEFQHHGLAHAWLSELFLTLEDDLSFPNMKVVEEQATRSLALKPNNWLAYHTKGACFALQNRLKEALPYLSLSLDLMQEQAGAYSYELAEKKACTHYLMARCLKQEENPLEAEAHLKQARELDPDLDFEKYFVKV